MARRKLNTRVRSAVTTSVKAKAGLVQPRSVKSRVKTEVKQLTVNQLEFLRISKDLERKVKRYAKKIGLVVTPDDVLGMLPDMPRKVTKKYLTKLIETSAKDLLEAWMPELKVAEPLVDKVVEEVVEQAVDKIGGKVSKGKKKKDDSLVSEVDVADKKPPSAEIDNSIIDVIEAWITEIPDAVYVYFKHRGMVPEMLDDYKQHLFSELHDNWGEYGDDYILYLLENQTALLVEMNEIPYVSKQDQLRDVKANIDNIISMGNQTISGQILANKANELLSGGSE